MEIIDKYKTIETESEGVYKEKGSKFFALPHRCLATCAMNQSYRLYDYTIFKDSCLAPSK
ncbi:MAG: hypothetical protein JEZ09_10790 [Salinivirgaceae bacterium]|nr:hypothetical protein [Salinivirgaceae bacterium]